MKFGRSRDTIAAWSHRTGLILVLGLASTAIGNCGPIHDAARKGDEAKVTALLEANPELVFSRDKFGNTPLHVAALHNQPAVAALLLANGADVNAINVVENRSSPVASVGETPLGLALRSYHHKEMVELLLTHGADPNMLSDGAPPLYRAVERDLPDDVELLLANGADPNAWGSVLYTVLHDKTKILEILLDYGADPNAKDMLWGHTALYYAESNSHEKAAALLRAHGAQ
jgi:ankyrin repeat protein